MDANVITRPGPANQPLIAAYRADRYASPHRTYVVLGAPRGGTSMLAGCLQLLGIPMGATGGQHEDPSFHDQKNIGRTIKTIGERNQSLRLWLDAERAGSAPAAVR